MIEKIESRFTPIPIPASTNEPKIKILMKVSFYLYRCIKICINNKKLKYIIYFKIYVLIAETENQCLKTDGPHHSKNVNRDVSWFLTVFNGFFAQTRAALQNRARFLTCGSAYCGRNCDSKWGCVFRKIDFPKILHCAVHCGLEWAKRQGGNRLIIAII